MEKVETGAFVLINQAQQRALVRAAVLDQAQMRGARRPSQEAPQPCHHAPRWLMSAAVCQEC